MTPSDNSSSYVSSSLSTSVVCLEGEQLYTLEYAASITETSITIVQVYVELGVIEASGAMLNSREIARIAQIQRLRQDLGLNLVGAAIVLDMATEIAQLRAMVNSHRSNLP